MVEYEVRLITGQFLTHMKILFVHDRLGAQAGAEANLFHTAVEMKRRGHQLFIAHGAGTGKEESHWRDLFLECFQLSPGSTVGNIATAIEATSPDIIYLHNPPDQSLVSFLADSHTPVVRMVHDHKLFCLRGCKYTPWSRRPCHRALGPYCVFPCGGVISRSSDTGRRFGWVSYRKKHRELNDHKRFARLIVASHYMRSELLRNGVRTSRIAVHPPVPPPTKTSVSPTFCAENRLVYAGQIARGKGVDVLLRSLARVKTSYECIILGEGHHRAHCESLSKQLGLTERVHFRGYVPQDELSSIYEGASMAVMSSVWPEPFGATGLEAMGCGLPVVAFDAGGIADWLRDGENGFLIPWMDQEGFAAAVETLLKDKAQARSFGERGRVIAEDQFGFGNYIDHLEDLFAEVFEQELEVFA